MRYCPMAVHEYSQVSEEKCALNEIENVSTFVP